MPNTSFADYVVKWEKLLASVEANRTDLAFLAELRSQLARVVEGMKVATVRQDLFKSNTQQTTRELTAFLTEGREIAVRLRNGIRTQYGLKGGKLVEFGMQPRRPQVKSKSKKKPDSAATEPGSEPSTNP
jgi:hypothetical protein